MSKSIVRVQNAAEAAGLDIEIRTMPDSTRTARDAAAACGCDVAQIVKSLVFEGVESGSLFLLLVSGSNEVDLAQMPALVGEPLCRANPKRVRAQTGFAIGGVAPIGHLSPLPIWMDETLLAQGTLWAAAGAPNAVFSVAPGALRKATGARVFRAN